MHRRLCEQRLEQKVTSVGAFEVCVPTHDVALRMLLLIMQVPASKLHFLANRNAGLAILPSF